MFVYFFEIYGHKNVLSAHRKTIEFTKDADLTKNGDCIVGVRSDFSPEELKKFLDLKGIKITIIANSAKDLITATPNKNFDSDREMVVRMGGFDSKRTFAMRADKAASSLNRDLVAALRMGVKATVTVSEA